MAMPDVKVEVHDAQAGRMAAQQRGGSAGPSSALAKAAVGTLIVLAALNIGLNATTLALALSPQAKDTARVPAGQPGSSNPVATLSAPMSPQNSAPQATSERPKVNFMFGANYPPYDFLQNLPGAPESPSGFGFEFAQEVCKVGNLDCRFIRDNYENCWRSDDFPGQGIQGGWYDACATYTDTFLRRTGVQFGHAFTTARPAGILTRLHNGQPRVAGTNDLNGMRIGLVGGWATNGESLEYMTNDCTGELISGYTTVTPKDEFAGPDAVMRALLDGEVDAVYMYASTIEDRSNPAGCTAPSCDISLYAGRLGVDYAFIHTGVYSYQGNGTTLSFSHQGSDVNALLNPLIQEVIRSKEYATLCDKYVNELGFSDITCFANDFAGTPPPKAPGAFTNSERPAEYQDCATGYCECGAVAAPEGMHPGA